MAIFRGKNREQEFDRELEFHLAALTRDFVTQGMPEEEARRRAAIELGGKEQFTQQLREAHSIRILDTMRANLRSGLRLLRKSPGFSAAVILTLALGIGSNSAVFSAIEAILLRSLPFPHAEQLVSIGQYDAQNKNPEMAVAPVRLEEWNRLNTTLQEITGYYVEDVAEVSGTLPEKLSQALVAPRFLKTWGISPALGRDFTAEEYRYGGPSAVLISYRFWRRRFHGDPEVVGKRLRIGSSAYSIVGVMPASFLFPVREVDLWTPVGMDAPFAQSRESTWFITVGRMKPGVPLAQARADLAGVQNRLGQQYPKTDAHLAIDLRPLKQTLIGGVGHSLWLLYGSVTLLLLIACTNISALLLARITDREQEISIRASLGASRARVFSQLLTETFLLAVIGAFLGLALAAASSRIFQALSSDLPRVDEIGLNWPIVLYSLGCALVTTFLCGMVPAWRATRRDLLPSLAQSGRSQVGGHHPMQWTLVGIQVALAVALLTGAGLLLRSFRELGRINPGFDPASVLTLRISASWGETGDMKGLRQRIDRTLDALRAVPGVEATAITAMLPGVPRDFRSELKVVDGARDANRKIVADGRYVSSGYFAALQVPLLQGQLCDERGTVQTAMVNRSFANAYFGSESPIGHHLASAAAISFGQSGEIRGIVGDTREEGLDTNPVPSVYWCVSAPNPDPYYLIRTHGDPMSMANTLRAKIHEILPSRAVYEVMPLEQQLGDAYSENRLRTLLLTLFALTAISLTAIGIYGVINYLGRTRRREIGVRLAMGALRQQIVGRYLGQALRVTAMGCACGLGFAALAGRLFAGMLFGVSALDLPTFALVIALVLAVAGCAAFIPALRASLTDPMSVLREE